MKKCAALVLVAVAMVFAGCSSGNGGGPTIDPLYLETPFDAIDRTNDSDVVRHGVIVSLGNVDWRHYDGWTGDCPGTDVDAAQMAQRCEWNGINYVTLRDEQATIANCIEAARVATQGLRAYDLLLLSLSGHGGQVPDSSGDEADGLDETLCLWDGELTDDVIGDLLLACSVTNLRVAIITDSCNSGSNYRARRMVTAIRAANPVCQVLHIGGCADGESSLGSGNGGSATHALCVAIDAAKLSGKPLTWGEWTRAAQPYMTNGQRLTFETWNASSEFLNTEAMR